MCSYHVFLLYTFSRQENYVLYKARTSENVHHNHFLSVRFTEFRTCQFKSFSNSKYLALAFSFKVAVTAYFSALYMLRNVLIVKLEKLYTVNLYVFLSALYTLQYVPIVIIFVIVYLFKKKKKQKKKKEKLPVLWYGQKYQSYATIPHYLSFLLGKGGNSYISKPYIKPKYKCTFCPTLSTKKIQIQTNVDDACQNCPKYVHFYPRILHLSSNRREQNLALYFQFTTPARKLTHTTKFEHFWMQKDMNFENTRILQHFGPEKCQKSAPERHKFWECHNSSALWAREIPKSAPKIHEFWQCHNSSLPWARESPNPTVKDMNFAQNCTH